MISYDQLVHDGTEQDFTAVVLLLKAGFIRPRKDLLDVSEVVLLRDNASRYQNSVLNIMFL